MVDSLLFPVVDLWRTGRRGARSAALGSLLIVGGGLTGCGHQVAGQPIGAAGFGPIPTVPPSTVTVLPAQATKTPPSSDNPDAVRIPSPHLAFVADTCELLEPADLQQLGGGIDTPQRGRVLPESCRYPLAGAKDDNIVVGFFKPFQQARAQEPTGWQDNTDGDDTWLTCASDNGYETCGASIAIQPDRTLVTILSKRDTSEDTVVHRLHTAAVAALHRLPPG